MNTKKILFNWDVILASLSLVVLLFTVITQIILRSFFDMPLMGAEELTRFMVLSGILFPLAYTERFNSHIVMEELQNLLPQVIKSVLRFLIQLSTTVVYILVTLSATLVLINNANNTTATLEIPFWIFFLPNVLGFLGISVLRIITHFCYLTKKELPWASL
ncbi:C4-dicarboxylate ABC transporter [Betaproteobacteria bacterium]|nr:C4-dicarboxylate ABC transporter [Betaproteobacteria bacterium]